MKDIDYELQFKTINTKDYDEVCRIWTRRRNFYTAEAAYRTARRLEGDGIDVAFAKYGDTYYVWTP